MYTIGVPYTSGYCIIKCKYPNIHQESGVGVKPVKGARAEIDRMPIQLFSLEFGSKFERGGESV